jgi:hypothetical protein
MGDGVLEGMQAATRGKCTTPGARHGSVHCAGMMTWQCAPCQHVTRPTCPQHTCTNVGVACVMSAASAMSRSATQLPALRSAASAASTSSPCRKAPDSSRLYQPYSAAAEQQSSEAGGTSTSSGRCFCSCCSTSVSGPWRPGVGRGSGAGQGEHGWRHTGSVRQRGLPQLLGPDMFGRQAAGLCATAPMHWAMGPGTPSPSCSSSHAIAPAPSAQTL